MCEALQAAGHSDMIREKTGLVVDAYFSAGTKLRRMLDNIKGARQRAQAAANSPSATVDSWLIWQLTDGKRHVTDVSNASRTMLFNIHTFEWDDELLALLDIPHKVLPEVVPSSGEVARTVPHLFGLEVPIAGIAGDQQAATFGQALPVAGHGEEHLWHRLLPADEYRPAAGGVRATGCSPRSAGRSAGRPNTASRAASSWACATIQWLRMTG
ncbi:FGGY family carbohydrate kinase [Cupriavidus basilensis]